jgi:uncharacterized protein YndB with AHSA1/START domain
MAERDPVKLDHTVDIAAPPVRVMAAFFDPQALATWLKVSRSLATPRPLGVYALEWPTSTSRDEILGPLGGVLHGTVIDHKAGRSFFVANVYWLPPEGDPIGPMALEVTCTARGRIQAMLGTLKTRVQELLGSRRDLVADPPSQVSTTLRVMQSGYEEGDQWRRYYEVIAKAVPEALDRLKRYLEEGQGVWDLRGYS